MNPNRDMERTLHLIADAITDGVCRSTTKRDERAQIFLDVRNALLKLTEQTLELAQSYAKALLDEHITHWNHPEVS